MPWIPIYAFKSDYDLLLNRLNEEANMLFIVSDGPQKWKAVDSLESLPIGRYGIWLKNAGPLPLIGDDPSDLDTEILDPEKGWEEKRTGADPETPYFGSGHSGLFWLNSKNYDDEYIGMTSFEWIGNHYRIIGRAAPKEAERAWSGLRRWVVKVSTKVPRWGAWDDSGAEIFAFPNALEEIKSGKIERDENP